MTFDQFLKRIEVLRKDRARGPEKPYKPLLLAAVLVLIAKRKISTPDVLLDGALKSVFNQLLWKLYPEWPFKADFRYPFRHLETDGIWRLVARDRRDSDLLAARCASAKTRDILRHIACAQIDDTVFSTLTGSTEAWLRALRKVGAHLPPGTIDVIVDMVGAPQLDTSCERPFTERLVEEALASHWSATPFAALGIALARRDDHGLPGRQVITPVNAIDLLGFQARENTWWVIELKRGRPPDRVVGQVSRYLGWISENHCALGQAAVGAIVAEGADAKLVHAVKANPRLSLWLYDDQLTLRRVH